MNSLGRAAELAREHDLHVVCVTVRGGVDEPQRLRILLQAREELAALLEAEGRPVWWREDDEECSLFVVDALAMDLKTRLVELEDAHPLGPWSNLDLVTVLENGQVGAWHGSPMRPEPRPTPAPEALQEALTALETDS